MKFFKSISKKIKSAEERLMESKILIMILPLILVLILILFSAPLLLNNQQLKQELEAKFANQLKAELKINGKVKTSLFPVPNVTFEEVYIRDLFTGSKTIHLHCEKVKVNLSILSAFLSKFEIKSIEATNTVMEIASFDEIKKLRTKDLIKLISQSQLKKTSQDGIGGNLFPVDKLNLLSDIVLKKIDFTLTDFDLIYYSKLGNKKQVKNINVSTKFKNGSLFADGDFLKQGMLTNFSINLNSSKTNKDSSIFLKSQVMEFSAKGKFSSSNTKNPDFFENFTGTLVAKIFNLKDFYRSFVSNNSFIFKKLRESSEPITISSSIVKEGSDLNIQDSEIQSQNIVGVSNIHISYLEKIPIVDIDLNLDFIDLDKILNEKTQKATKEDLKKSNSPDEKSKKKARLTKKAQGDLLKISKDLRDFDLNLELKIEKAKYLFEEINEINLYSSISKNGEVLILPLKFKTPGNGNFRITGIFENRNDNPRFLGKLDATGESLSMLLTWLDLKMDNLKYTNLNEYSIYSDIFQKPGTTHFDNLYVNIKDGPEILGQTNIYHQHGLPYIVSKIDIADLDISRFFQTSSKNTYLSPGSLLKKLLWVNSLNSRSDLEISINDLKYHDQLYFTNSFKARLGKGYFEIDNMKIESEDSDLSTSLAIQIKESISRFNLSLKSDKFNIAAKETSEDIDFKKDISDENFSLTDTLFSLPSFKGFSGNVIIDFKDSKIGGINLSNSKIEAKLDNGIARFTKFRSAYKDGRLNFTGSAAIKFDKSLSGNLTLTKFPIEDILGNLYGINNITGTANISSSISSFGNKKSEFISNMSLKSKYSASKITVKNYGLDELIKKMFNFAKYTDEISEPADILYSQIESTKINNSSGSVSINRKTEDFFKGSFSGTAFNGTINSKFSNHSLSAQGGTNIVFLTGNRKKQIPINIASNFKGAISNLDFTDNFSQAQTYIDRAKKFYSNPRNKNRRLLKTSSKKRKPRKANQQPISKSKIITPNQAANNQGSIANQREILDLMKAGQTIPYQPPIQAQIK